MEGPKYKSIDFLAIGDIVNDEFIDLAEAQVTCDAHGEECILSMRFGDKIPYKEAELVRAVGNAPNASVSAARLGLRSAMMTHVGDDDHGQLCVESLAEDMVSTDFVTVENGQKTNHHYVLRYKAERTILIKHANFKYNLKKQTEGKPVPKWIYFSSVAENSINYHHEIAEWVRNEGIKMAFQPGTFQISLGYEKLKDIYEVSEIFFCNVEEARRILTPVLPTQNIQKMSVHGLLKAMRNLGPKIVCITDGPDGAYTYDGKEGFYMPAYPDPAPPVDRTGAGDSFSSTFTTAIVLGKSIDEAIAWGPINSMSVVQYVGAQRGLLSKEKLLEFFNNAPSDYKVERLNIN